jgi:hypothetical protein
MEAKPCALLCERCYAHKVVQRQPLIMPSATRRAKTPAGRKGTWNGRAQDPPLSLNRVGSGHALESHYVCDAAAAGLVTDLNLKANLGHECESQFWNLCEF